METTIDIFSYHDFRQYIRDRVEAVRAEQEHLSIREILRRVQCASPSYYKEVILDGKKRMSPAAARRFAAFFMLSAPETEYFLLLLNYNQAKTELDRLHFLDKLMSFKKRPVTASHFLTINEYGYMAEWHHAVIRELLPLLPEFGNRNEEERRQLARLLRVKLTDRQIDESITLLESLKFVRRNKQGNFEKTDTTIRVEKKTPAAYKTLCEFMNMAKTVINTTDAATRLVKMAVLNLDAEAYAIIEKKLNEAFQEIVEVAADKKGDADRLYAMNMQFFPLTRLPGEE